MLDMNDFIKTVQAAALNAVEAEKPTSIIFGTVQSTSPLTVFVDAKLTIPEKAIVLSRNVTDFDTEVTVEWRTENTSGGGGGYDAFSSHNHAITGRKPIRVNNALKSGEKVILIRMAGGQKYLIIDRVV